MKELGEALKLLVEKLGILFDVFDLSFVVSGITTFAFLLAMGQLMGFDIAVFFNFKLWWVLVILGVYVSGVVSFSSGRWLRQTLSHLIRGHDRLSDFDTKFGEILIAHGLNKEDGFREYTEKAEFKGGWRLYIRMWAELRHNDSAAPSLQLVNRYWVMSATYDGMSISLILWSGFFVFASSGAAATQLWSFWVGGAGAAIMLLLSVSCMREASRYVDYQVEDVVASIAAFRAYRRD